jgi:paraquat-inducible protein B
MSDREPPTPSEPAFPEPVVRAHGGPSLVWLIPIITALIGGWLIFHTLAEKGPLVTVTFRTAEGIEIGKTRVKYKSLDIGIVESVQFSPDFSRVEVRARLSREAAHFLRRDTRFWVVKPTLGVRGISGLSTLISGAYIEIEPGQGAPQTLFVGLEVPPVITADEAGKRITLMARRLGSIDRGSLLHYQGIVAGEVLGYEMANDYRSVLIHAFVKAPYDRLVRSNTRFWSASGLDLSAGPDGVRVRTESLQALLFGGIAFDTPDAQDVGTEDIDGLVFTLYDDYRSIREQAYTAKVRFVLFFDDSVRGLAVGAPVEFKGIKIGSVVDVRLEYDAKSSGFRIPVTVEVEPERVLERGEAMKKSPRDAFQALVKRGLRARLATGNLLTGQLYVDLDMHPNTPLKLASMRGSANGGDPELPTVPANLEQMTVTLKGILERLEKVDFEGIGRELQGTLKGANAIANAPQLERSLTDLSASMASAKSLLAKVDARAEPLTANLEQTLAAARDALEKAKGTMAVVDGVVSPDAPFHDLTRELSEAARALRSLVDMLERNPQSLIFGKKPSGEN